MGCYFYPRSPCGERHAKIVAVNAHCYISIHALLAESDIPLLLDCITIRISIHALLAESDSISSRRVLYIILFLSTLSLRRATIIQWEGMKSLSISIHALLAESDNIINCNSNFKQKFLSTLSLRRATWLLCYTILACLYFYPRSPCGERLRACPVWSPRLYFYPRSPCGERQYGPELYTPYALISIHALLAESDF